jgi:hypothetical protein
MYKNPLDYQVKTFEKEGEEDVRVSFINDTAQSKVPEGFIEKGASTTATPTTPPPLVAPTVTTTSTPAVANTQKALDSSRTAKQILKSENIGTAKDILAQTYFRPSEDFAATQGKSVAQSILEQEFKIQESKAASEAFAKEQQTKKMQEELEFQKKEKEFINNLDPNSLSFQQKPVYNTRFGELDFTEAKYSKPTAKEVGPAAATNVYAKINIGDQEYYFMPEEFVYKGTTIKDPVTKKQTAVVNGAFLTERYWEMFLNRAQYIDLSESGIDTKTLLPQFSQEEASRGFLLKKEDVISLNQGSFLTWDVGANPWSGTVAGMARKDGKMIYVLNNVGKAEAAWLNPDGYRQAVWTEASSFQKAVGSIPIIGKPIVSLSKDIAKTFAEIPYAAEIVGVATGNPYLYASLKALEVAGKGGTLEDAAKAAVVAYATTAVPMKTYGASVGNYLQSTGMITNATAANAVGGAIVGSMVQGTIAAIQGKDVKEAMTIGAISGGLNQTSIELTTKLVGGADNLSTLAKLTNVSPTRLSNVVSGAFISGSVAALQDKDFFTAFGTSLISQGLGEVAASNLIKELQTIKTADGKLAFSKEVLNDIGAGVKNTVSAAARAAVRGEDFETALKVVGARSVADIGGGVLGRQLNLKSS